ncbi:MAG: hypothetical protein Q8904_14000, partial [Bacteroidota bacterium]|nr:hypothetical protein [Bacteroidota bacterium]
MTTFTTPKKNNHPACLVYTKFLITLILLLSLTTLQAATYYSRASGNWNTNTTWSLTSGGAAVGSGVYPVAGDVAIIQGGFTVSISANAACATLQVGNSGSGILSFGTTTSITLNTTGNVTVNSGSSITSTTNGNQAHTFTIGGNINCAGTWDMYGNNSTDDINVILNGTFQTISGAGTFGWNSLTVNSGSITTVTSTKSQTVYGNLTITGTLDIGTTTFNRSSSGGTLTVSGKMLLGSNTGGQTGSNFPTNFSTQTLSGGTVVYNYAGAQTVYATPSYTNLTLSGSGIKTITGAKVNGILSMEGTATTTGTPTYGSAATLQYNTATPLTAGSEWVTPFAGTGGVIITNTGAITMNAAKVFNASVPLTINTNASLATNNFQVTFGGNFTNAGTFTAGSSAVVITNTMSAQSISGFTTTGNVSMTKTGGTATLQGNVSATSLIINGTGGTLTLGTGLTHTFSGLITLTAGSLNGGSSTLNENATSTTAWSGTGSLFTAGTGTVNFGGTTQTISATGTTTFTNLTFSNSGVKTISNTVVVNGVLSMEGTATATVSGTLTYGSSATLQYKGSSAQTTGNEFVSPFTGNGGVKINNSNGVTLGSARSVGSNPFTIGNLVSNSLFNDGGFQLTAAGTLNLTSGTYSVKYSSFPAFTTTNIATGTTVDYSATASQTVKGITYSNLNISGTGNNSKVSDGNITVNGILNLSSANASATQGCLDMGTNSLNMGAAATTTGTGDVTGIVTRTSFAVNTPYSFGNQFTTLNMAAGGTLPGSVSVKVVLSAAHTWKANSINRYYDIIQTGGSSATLVTINLHYLPGELNGATEGNLDLFDYHVSQTLQVDDHGRSNFSTTDKWVGTTNRPLTYIAPQSAFPSKYWTLGTSTTPSFTWLGANSSDWTDASNWVGNVPGPSDAVVIPDAGTTNYDPSLPASVTIGSINIQAGGILNDGGGSALTITGGVGAWNDLGTFNAGTSTVIFTSASATMANSTNFYNVTVDNGGNLTLGTNNVMRIGGTLSLSSTGVLNAADTHNTVEYNGSNQTVIYPNGSTSGYSYLILSGSGTKTMPASPLNISGDLVMSGTASVTALNTLNIAGNVTLGSGTVFAASSFTHTVSGNWTNNGATFTPGTGTITFNGTSAAQSINGTSASQTFNNIIINKASQLLNVGGSTTSLSVNNLTETSGSFTAPATLVINGNVTITAGTFTAGSATSTIMGNVTLAAGSYIAGTTTNLLGNWNNNGATLIAGTGAFNFNGSSPQTLGGTTS